MKRLTGVALALLTLLGLIACGSPTSSKGDKTTVVPWKIKSVVDGWQDHAMTFDQINNVWTYSFSGMYATTYEFVLINPSGTEVKYGSDEAVALGEEFTMGGSSNVRFVPEQVNYTLQVSPASATAPVAILVGSGGSAPALDEAGLAKYLYLKGDAFSIGWTNTAGTYDSGTKSVSWDVTYSTKNGSFGFASLDNFLQGVTIDLSALTEGGSGTDDQTLLTSGGNAKLTGAPKAGSVYTITVSLDVTAGAAAGRYQISAQLKTLSSADWTFDTPATIYPTGDLTGGWNEADTAAGGKRPPVTITSGVGTFTYTATAAGSVGFKFALEAGTGWNHLQGYAQCDVSGSDVEIVADGENLSFTAEQDHEYTVTFDFTGDYATTGIPAVSVTDVTGL